ncbi:MAG: ADP-glyceromanno-heptose 6-epimerase [Deferribacteraceae bacterium]|jgi:ADP-L-glycero-D-manno-heptose 6-epimerase|nr:ADP-glyceromanno-heptose 6-epimerase [Deferribacteraceae bacterium]
MIIVTGAAGFIGSNIVHALNKRGIKDILIVDDLKDGSKHKNLNKLEFIDYVDYRDFIKYIDNYAIELIFHQGACSDTTEPDGRYMMEVNYEYTKILLHHAMKKKFRLIYASSASVYGEGKAGFKEAPECEYPLNMYAFSKYQFDRYYNMLASHTKIDTQIVGLRYFNVYGPQENHKGKMASVPFHMFNQVQAGAPMKLFEGSDKFLRDFIYIDDAVDVNLFFMDNPDKSGVFNCGTGTAASFQALADNMQLIFPQAKLDYIPFPAELKGKYQEYTQADLSKLRAAGYNKEFAPISTGVRSYMNVLQASGGYIR